MMLSIFSERYYGHPPYSTAFIRHPSDRTPTVVRDDDQGQTPTPRADHPTRSSRALGGRHRHGGLPQPRYRRARTQARSAGRDRGPATPHSARAGADRDARVESRALASGRPRPAHRRCPQCQLDNPLIGDISGWQDPGGGHRRDRPLISARRWRGLQAADLDPQTQSRRAPRLRGKRLRVEVILAGAGTPTPPPVTALVEADLLEEVPPDVEELRSLLPHADLYLQDEVQFAFHPTLTRVWCRKGRRGQRLVEAPGANDTVYGFGLVDWGDGWFEGRLAPGRTADVLCAQVRAAVARSCARGHMAIVIADNLRTHTPAGSKLVRQMVAELHDHLRLLHTPAYDPDANRIAGLWRWSRREVTHNHQRTTFAALLEDIQAHFEALRQHPNLVLRQIGSPFADQLSEDQVLACAA